MSKLDQIKAALKPGQKALYDPNTEQTILLPEPQVADSVAATLAQRGSRYGDFTDHARLCQGLMSELTTFSKIAPNPGSLLANATIAVTPWDYLDPVKKQALTVIMDKVARILSGDPNYDDNWHDIQGYAKLVEDRLSCNQVKDSKND